MNRGVSWSGRERNCVYMNLAGERFVDASFASGLDFADDGRAVAVVDVGRSGPPRVRVTGREAAEAHSEVWTRRAR